MSANRSRHDASGAPVILVMVLALGGCELGLHEVSQARSDGCELWQARCPAVIDFAGPGPTNPPRADIARTRIVTSAENAPYRPCDGVALACQARVSGDVLWDEYVMVLAGEGNGMAGTAAPPPAPRAAPAAAPAGAAPVGAGGRVVRTEGTRRGDDTPVRQYAPPR